MPFFPTAEPGARLTADLLPHKNLPLVTMAADIFRQALVVTTEAVTQCKAKEACVFPYHRLSIEAITCQAV